MACPQKGPNAVAFALNTFSLRNHEAVADWSDVNFAVMACRRVGASSQRLLLICVNYGVLDWKLRKRDACSAIRARGPFKSVLITVCLALARPGLLSWNKPGFGRGEVLKLVGNVDREPSMNFKTCKNMYNFLLYQPKSDNIKPRHPPPPFTAKVLHDRNTRVP